MREKAIPFKRQNDFMFDASFGRRSCGLSTEHRSRGCGFPHAADPEAGWASRNPTAPCSSCSCPRDCGALDELMAL
jgi:hypothetical protein